MGTPNGKANSAVKDMGNKTAEWEGLAEMLSVMTRVTREKRKMRRGPQTHGRPPSNHREK